jgi:hypothetical protein
MADVIDLDEYRKKHDPDDPERKLRRRRTPGGRGFGDMTDHLSTGKPSPPPESEKDGDDDDDNTPQPA